jgi:hypothetical protein
MTVAEATRELDAIAERNDRAFLGHPKGLGFFAANALVGWSAAGSS